MIDWKSKIDANGRVDMADAVMHDEKYGKASPKIKVYGYTLKLPLAPPDEEFVNHGLPIEEQKFRKTFKPKSINLWDKEDQEKWIAREYHRKHHGVWMFIKGKKYYIPGVMYFFMNYWNLQSGEEVIFRITDLHFFLMLMHCFRDPRCLGLIDFKCRQIGDTEKVLCFIYWFTSRYRNMKAAMQSVTETHVKKSYKRLVYAYKKMDWFMKVQNKGSDNPEGDFVMDYPSSLNSNKKNAAQFKAQGTASMTEAELMYEHAAIESVIQYFPTDAYACDSQTWNIWYCDEFGKMLRMDPIEALGVVAPAMVSRIMDKLLGIVIMTSTVEELSGGKTLKWAKELWKHADPGQRMEDEKTPNGLYRIFRGALDRAPVDEWGFPKAEEELVKIKLTMKGYLNRRDIKGLIRYRRKNALTIDDVFMSAENESGFHIENLAARQIMLQNQKIKKEVFGNLKWKDGIPDTEVIWEPNPSGRWSISLHPSEHGFENNAKIDHIQLAKPSNILHFCGAVDPYDQKTNIEKDLSDGGIVVRRKFDANFDGGKFDSQGKPEHGGLFWETERVVCDYRFRWQNPNDFYEDVILTFVYFGTQFLFEKNKGGGLESYITTRGYALYIQEQPQFTRNKKAENMDIVGITATENSVNQAFELLQTETCDYANTIHHSRYLGELLRMNWENRGENDIGMAGGWAKVSSLRMLSRKKNTEEQKSMRHYEMNEV